MTTRKPPLVADVRFPRQAREGIVVDALVLPPLAHPPANPEPGLIFRGADGALRTFMDGQWRREGAQYSYVHRQAMAASVWTISHPLSYRPAVHTVDDAGTQVLGEVEYPELRVVRISFLVPISGYAFLT